MSFFVSSSFLVFAPSSHVLYFIVLISLVPLPPSAPLCPPLPPSAPRCSVDYFRQDCGTLIGIAMGFKVLYLVLMVVKCNRVSRLAPPKEEEEEDKAEAEALLVRQEEEQVVVKVVGEEGAGDVEMDGISMDEA